MKKIDLYILRNFLGTFFFSLLLILSIAVVFDFTEKIDDFIEKESTARAIIFDYYLNFIPYFANLFTPLFVFISVIFFTSKMAYQSEIIAILSSGVSFRRMMFPYFLGALTIGIFTFLLGSFIIPKANITRLEFEDKTLNHKPKNDFSMTHMQIEPGVFVFLNRYFSFTKKGDYLTIEKFDGKTLVSKLTAVDVRFDSVNGKWQLKNYVLREFNHEREMKVTTGSHMDTTLNLRPSDFSSERMSYEKMTSPQLNAFIEKQEARGLGNIEQFVIEKYRRIASPFSAFILTLIGVSLASRKVRGGMGVHIGTGLALSFGYILFMTISTTFAVNGSMNPLLSVWLPNIVFAIIGAVIYYRAPK